MRIPAALTGVVGFKPSYGALSTEGVFPLSRSLDHVGIITGNPADAAAVYAVLAPVAERPSRVGLDGLNLGWVPPEPFGTQDPQVIVNATIFDRFSPFLMSAIHQPG
nr:amidase family protein [Serratia ficaria]